MGKWTSTAWVGLAVLVVSWGSASSGADGRPAQEILAEIGISLDRPKDEGGLDRLKAFLAKNQIPWPQFYLNEGAEKVSPLIRGGMGVPRVFVVDQEGKLYSIHAPHGKLETMIPELLEKGPDKDKGKVDPKE